MSYIWFPSLAGYGIPRVSNNPEAKLEYLEILGGCLLHSVDYFHLPPPIYTHTAD